MVDMLSPKIHTLLMTTNNEQRIAKYAREMAETIIDLRAEGTAWARAEAARLTGIAQERCRQMRTGR